MSSLEGLLDIVQQHYPNYSICEEITAISDLMAEMDGSREWVPCPGCLAVFGADLCNWKCMGIFCLARYVPEVTLLSTGRVIFLEIEWATISGTPDRFFTSVRLGSAFIGWESSISSCVEWAVAPAAKRSAPD